MDREGMKQLRVCDFACAHNDKSRVTYENWRSTEGSQLFSRPGHRGLRARLKRDHRTTRRAHWSGGPVVLWSCGPSPFRRLSTLSTPNTCFFNATSLVIGRAASTEARLEVMAQHKRILLA